MTDTTGNEARMGDLDALLWAIERDPRLASTVMGVSMFEPAVDATEARSRVERLSRVVPRLRQRVVGNPASLSPPRWEHDQSFDLDRHLIILDGGQQTMADVLALAASASVEPFDRERPLWQFFLVQNVDGDASALIMKAHHAIADGMGLLSVQLELFDFEPDGEKPPADEPEIEPPLSALGRLDNAVRFETQRGLVAMKDLLSATLTASSDVDGLINRATDTLGSAARSMQPVAPLSPVMTERSKDVVFRTLSLELPVLKRAAKAAGTRLNAVFVAGALAGVGRYHEEMGVPVERLRMGMPVSRRSRDEAAPDGNFFTPVRLELPVTAEEPAHLCEIVEALVDAQRDEPALDLLGPAANVLARLPAPLAAATFGQVLSGTDFLTSNLPGSPFPMYFAGSQMTAQFPYGPISTAALNLTLLSYLDGAHVGISIDCAAVTEPDRMVAALRAGYDWVLG